MNEDVDDGVDVDPHPPPQRKPQLSNIFYCGRRLSSFAHWQKRCQTWGERREGKIKTKKKKIKIKKK